MTWTAGAGVALALAVILGAFGAHALKGRLDADALGIWEKAVLYHFIHAMGILIASRIPRTDAVNWLLLAGIVLFSGSLYLLATTDVRFLGAITPLGGLCFIAGWLLLAWRCYSK